MNIGERVAYMVTGRRIKARHGSKYAQSPKNRTNDLMPIVNF